MHLLELCLAWSKSAWVVLVNLCYCFFFLLCCALDYVWVRGAGCSADAGLCGEYRDVRGMCCTRRVRELGATLCLCGCRPLGLEVWREEGALWRGRLLDFPARLGRYYWCFLDASGLSL